MDVQDYLSNLGRQRLQQPSHENLSKIVLAFFDDLANRREPKNLIIKSSDINFTHLMLMNPGTNEGEEYKPLPKASERERPRIS
jgi:hypothetical protein